MSRGALAVSLAATLAACGPDVGGNGGSTAATVGDSTTTTVPRDGDHVLELGVLLPQTGPNAAIGLPMIQAIQLAVTQINSAGGFDGMPVKLVIADEGADANATKVGLAQLLDVAQNPQIDAVIGPLASADALACVTDAGRPRDPHVLPRQHDHRDQPAPQPEPVRTHRAHERPAGHGAGPDHRQCRPQAGRGDVPRR